MFKEKISNLKFKLIQEKKNIPRIIFSVAVTIFLLMGYHFLGNHMTTALWIATAVLLTLLLSIMMFLAGFAVLKSIFFVATELSLLIFLAQTYCDLPNSPASGKEALKSLLVVGLVYIIISFVRSLHEALKKYYVRIKDEKWSMEKTITVVLVLFFTGLFIYEVHLVTAPIIQNLCVFK